MRFAPLLSIATVALFVVTLAEPASAADGSLLTNLENNVRSATQGWQDTVINAATSLFWILAGIEFGIAAIWLAIAAPSLDTWAAELIRRILFIGFFLFVLQQGPTFAKAVVDSLFQLGAEGGQASPADVFNAGMKVASALSEHVKFGIFEDNQMAIGIIFAMVIVVICFSMVAAIFVSVLVEMYVGLLAGMIMLGLGGSSFTKDFAIKYLIYAFSVGMKLMALVMIARIGSEILIGLAHDANTGEELLASLVIAGLSVVVFIISIYVPNIVQGVVAGTSVSNGMEVMRTGSQVATFAAAAATGVGAGVAAGGAAAASAKAGGSGLVGQMTAGIGKGLSTGASTSARAMANNALDKAVGIHGTRALGLKNQKTDGKS